MANVQLGKADLQGTPPHPTPLQEITWKPHELWDREAALWSEAMDCGSQIPKQIVDLGNFSS